MHYDLIANLDLESVSWPLKEIRVYIEQNNRGSLFWFWTNQKALLS